MRNNQDTDIEYNGWKDIFNHHGFIILILYWISCLLRLTPTRLWILLGEKIKRDWWFDSTIERTKPWWQDSAVVLHALATVFVSVFYPCTIFAWILIVDVIAYHSSVLWFDDIIPKQTPQARKVLSHRRVLFQGIINFVESIFLFGVLYMNCCGSSGFKTQIYQASFEVATTLSRSTDLLSCPNWLINTQVGLSIFFLVVVISIVASVAYKREEFAP